MVKVSITLPNATQISLEAEEAEISHGVVGIVLRDLPQDLMVSALVSESRPTSPTELEKGSSVTSTVSSEKAGEGHQDAEVAPDTTSNSESPQRSSGGTAGRQRTAIQSSTSKESSSPQVPARVRISPVQESDFAEFCRSANPLGDMRRVVVAAEAANRILAMPSVDAEELAGLFDLAGWHQAHNFTQTLRNAARDKFRWLERLPGRTGRYAVTELGRSLTLGK